MRAWWFAIVAACGGGGGGPTGPGDGTSGPFFETPMFFDQDVSGVQKSATSDTQIAALRSEGGWGNGDFFQIDFSFDVLEADADTPSRSFSPNGDFSTPDCDEDALVPVPDGGNVEGEEGYDCTSGDDCHLIVYQPSQHRLFELWEASIDGNDTSSGCTVVWDTSEHYPDTLRGDQCTSADAAGLPIAPLLFTADEVAAGEINHAVRFILPNDRVQKDYVRPATHGTFTTGDEGAPNYGVQLRLRADYPVDDLPSEGAKVVARALQKYGMYHADGGNIALTGQSDRRTVAKWDGLLDTHDLGGLQVEDFEVIDHGDPVLLTLDCVRD